MKSLNRGYPAGSKRNLLEGRQKEKPPAFTEGGCYTRRG